MVSQNVLNLVDTGMVGRLGDAALAGVGVGSFLNFMSVALLMGLSAGVQAMASRRQGEGRRADLAVPLNGALILALSVGLPLGVLLWTAAPTLFGLVNAEVADQGVPYLQARLLCAPAVGLNFAFRGHWNGVSRSVVYLRTLVLMHVVNIALNWVLIFGNLGAPELGTEGAGLASAVSVWVGAAYYTVQGWSLARDEGFLRRLPSATTMKTMLRLSVPSSIQQVLFAAGYVALFKILSLLGTEETAAANVLVQIMLVALLPGIGLGMAAATLVGQALGRADPDDARRWGWDVVGVAMLLMGSLGALMVVFPEPLLAPFLTSPETRELARVPLQVFGAGIALDGIGLVLMNALLGAGASRQVAVVSIAMQWGFFLPLAFLFGPWLGYGLLAIWLVQLAYRVIQAMIFALLWSRGRWAQVRV